MRIGFGGITNDEGLVVKNPGPGQEYLALEEELLTEAAFLIHLHADLPPAWTTMLNLVAGMN